jgi:hypothetical protein
MSMPGHFSIGERFSHLQVSAQVLFAWSHKLKHAVTQSRVAYLGGAAIAQSCGTIRNRRL